MGIGDWARETEQPDADPYLFPMKTLTHFLVALVTLPFVWFGGLMSNIDKEWDR